MRLFLDTNVIIDVLAAREPFVADSQAIFTLCETGKVECFVSTLSFCTISYVLRKFVSQGTMRDKLQALRNILRPVELSVSNLDKAIASSIPDFEDAIQFYTAISCEADYIITRNVKHFPQDHIPILTPTDFLALTYKPTKGE